MRQPDTPACHAREHSHALLTLCPLLDCCASCTCTHINNTQPGPSLLPLQHIAAAAADRLAGPKADPFILQYGPEQGNISFRRCLADFLSSETGHPVDPEELLITAGACVVGVCAHIIRLCQRRNNPCARTNASALLLHSHTTTTHTHTGVSHGLDLACRHLGAVGGHILVEQPTYFLAGNILKQAGLTPVRSVHAWALCLVTVA